MICSGSTGTFLQLFFVAVVSYQTVYKCTPEEHRKLVHNIYKTTQRLKRQKMAARRERKSVSVKYFCLKHLSLQVGPCAFYSSQRVEHLPGG